MTFVSVTDVCRAAFAYRTAASTCLKVNMSEPSVAKGKLLPFVRAQHYCKGSFLLLKNFWRGGEQRGPPTTQAISSDVAFYYYYLFRL